jgi:hypothetical protein
MHVEVWIFMAFGVLQILFHQAHKLTSVAFLKKLSENHWVVWIFHPVVAHTAQDYIIHFVIYSGRIITGH